MQKRTDKPVLAGQGTPNNASHSTRSPSFGRGALRLAAFAMTIAFAPSHAQTTEAPSVTAPQGSIVAGAQAPTQNTCLDPIRTGRYRGYSNGRTNDEPANPNGCVFYAFVGSLEENIKELLAQHEHQHYRIDPRITCAEYQVAAPYTVSGASLPQLLANFLKGFPLRAVIHKPDGFVRVEISDTKAIPRHCNFGVNA